MIFNINNVFCNIHGNFIYANPNTTYVFSRIIFKISTCPFEQKVSFWHFRTIVDQYLTIFDEYLLIFINIRYCRQPQAPLDPSGIMVLIIWSPSCITIMSLFLHKSQDHDPSKSTSFRTHRNRNCFPLVACLTCRTMALCLSRQSNTDLIQWAFFEFHYQAGKGDRASYIEWLLQY